MCANRSRGKLGWRIGVGATAGLAMSVAAAAAQETTDLEAIELPPIIVEGDPEAVTEGTESYASDHATVGGKQPQDLRDVPQTVAVITREAIDDIGADSIEEASYILPGLTNATGDGFVGSLYARGQEVFQYYVDGAPRPYLSIYGTAPDLYFFDRLEVMSGPSGVFQGSGEPVGTLNLVRKRPTADWLYQGGVSGDTFGGYRAEADIGGPVSADGDVRLRIAAFGEHEDSFVDITEKDSAGVYATLEADVSDATTVAIGGIYEVSDTVRHSGLPTFSDGTLLDVSRDTFIGSPDNSAEIPTAEAFVELEHAFDFGGVAKVTGRVYNQTAELRNLLPSSAVDPLTGDFSLFWFARDWEQQAYYADANLTTPFRDWALPTEIVIGADYRRVFQDFKQTFDFSPGAANIDTFDPYAYSMPTFAFPGVGPGFNLNTETTTDEAGVYGQARIELLDRLKLNVGARFSSYESETVDTGRSTSSDLSEINFAPYVGVTYDVLDDVTVYASYATIFQPQTELAADGTNLEPRQGRQVELGVKSEFFDGALNTQASVYVIDDENRALDDPDNVGFFVASGEAQTRGAELLVSGSPYPGFEIFGGYAYVDTELTNDPTPAHNFSLFGKYTFDDGRLDGVALGAGVRAFSGFDNLDGGTVIEAGGAAVLDLYAGYAVTDDVELQLNVNNVFDREYVERVNTTARGTYYGEPLNARLGLNVAF